MSELSLADACAGTVVRSWDELVAAGRQAIDGFQWKLGDLAAEVETAYGDASLAAYATEVGVAYDALRDYRYVASAYGFAGRPANLSFGVAKAFAAQPDRLELTASRKWTVAQARELAASRRAPSPLPSGGQPSLAPPPVFLPPAPEPGAGTSAGPWPEPPQADSPGPWGNMSPASPDESPPSPEPPLPLQPSGAHVGHNSGDNEWYTPAEYVKAAKAIMGDVDLDPASSEIANSVVSAYRFYTEADDGLSKPWSGRVWMNPPYAQPFVAQFAARLVESFANGNVTEACVLVNNATETAWFSGMLMQASAVCFPRGRIRFWHPSKESAPLQGQAILYLGPNADAFTAEFAQFGPTSPWGAR